MSRIESVDAFRVLAIVAVIALHAAVHFGPFAVASTVNVRMLLSQVERFAVPFFFMVSGYFWASKCRDQSEFWYRSVVLSKRVLLIFFGWSLVYLAEEVFSAIEMHGMFGAAKLAYWGLHGIGPNFATLNLLVVGPKDHLWFLPALVFAALTCGAMLSVGKPQLLLALALVLFLTGLAGGAYANTPVGFHMRFNFRNGPFFSLIAFATGCALQRNPQGIPTAWSGASLAAGGLLLQVVEVVWLHRTWGTYLSQDYTLGTYFYGLGITILALSNARSFRISALSTLGPLVLGIYASHVLFIDMLRPVDDQWRGHMIWDVSYVGIVFMVSLIVTRVLARWQVTRPFVL
jgi:surface polysaccharide O-acyltransferase-like enzyme